MVKFGRVYRRKSSVAKTVQKRRRRVNVGGKKLATSVKKLVQRSISANLENKSIITYQEPTPLSGGIRGQVDQTLSPDTFPLFPPIAPGNKSHQRVGQKIRPISMIVSGYVWLNPTLDTQGNAGLNTTGVNVRLIFCSVKGKRSYTALDQTDPTTNADGYQTVAQNLLTANGLESKFDGTLERALSFRLNHKRITTHSVKYLSLKRDWSPSVSVPTAGGALQAVKRPFSVRIPVPKNIFYASDTTQIPSQFAPILMAGYNYDSGVPTANTPQGSGPLITFTTRIVYEDA